MITILTIYNIICISYLIVELSYLNKRVTKLGVLISSLVFIGICNIILLNIVPIILSV